MPYALLADVLCRTLASWLLIALWMRFTVKSLTIVTAATSINYFGVIKNANGLGS